jgi:hypothetical protein
MSRDLPDLSVVLSAQGVRGLLLLHLSSGTIPMRTEGVPGTELLRFQRSHLLLRYLLGHESEESRMPTAPRASIETASQPADARVPIGAVHVIVYDWLPGQTEVQIQWPKEALHGAADAGSRQDTFSKLVKSELADAIDALGGAPG